MSESKQVYYLVGAIVIVMVVILLMRFWIPEPTYETREYNGYDFKKIDGLWYFEWQRENKLFTVGLRNPPWELEDVPVRGILSEKFNRGTIYVTHDPGQGENSRNFTIMALGAVELTSSMASSLGLLPVSACTNNESGCIADHIKNCESENSSVILLTDIGEAGIQLQNECIVLRGEGMNLLKSIDRLLYQWYGMMGTKWSQ